MIAGLDSSFAVPNAAQLAQAFAAGVRLWAGYMATRPNVGLANTWAPVDFDRAKKAGMRTLAYVSGNDNPWTLKALAQLWQVPICLDVESSIRGDGAWVQGWLDASGAGLYGNYTVHLHRTAAFHVMAGYPGVDPGRTWPADQPKPATPLGWQWQGTHTEFGCSVDRGWYDDGFPGSVIPPPAPQPIPSPSVTGDTQSMFQVLVAQTPDGAYVVDSSGAYHAVTAWTSLPTVSLSDGDFNAFVADRKAAWSAYAAKP